MQEEDFTPREQRRLRTIFDNIKKHAGVSEEERNEKRGIVNDVLNSLMREMKWHDKLFNEMFVELTYTGSYFDNLRIVDANEFDINVVLQLPVRSDKIMVESNVAFPSFTELRLDYTSGDPTKAHLTSEVKGRFLKLLDEYDRVVPEKVLSWMQSVLAKASASSGIGGITLFWSSSGPAKTVKIRVEKWFATIDVDLVAVFRLHLARWPENRIRFRYGIVEDVYPPSSCGPSMYLVPKRYEHVPAYMWRKHLPEVERELLCGKGAVKPVIRILKLLRDRKLSSRISSYYLKTLVMIEVYNHLHEEEYWIDKRTPFLVFAMMAKLQEYLSEGFLPHLLYRDVNLFCSLSSVERYNYSQQLKYILVKCKSDIERIEKFFIRDENVPRQTREEVVEVTEDEEEEDDFYYLYDDEETKNEGCVIL